MSEGSAREDRIMAPLMLIWLPSEHYNRIYEAVEMLPDSTAQRLVASVRTLLDIARGGSDGE